MEEVGDMDAGDLQRRHPTRIRRFPRSSACHCPDLGRTCLGPSFAPSSDRYGPAGPFRLLSKPRSLAAAQPRCRLPGTPPATFSTRLTPIAWEADDPIRVVMAAQV